MPEPDSATDESETSSSSVGDRKIESKYIRYERNSTFADLLESLPSDSKYVSVDAFLDFYEHMKGNYLIRPDDLKHPKFRVLREATESFVQEMNTKELKEILVSILPSKAVMHDKLTKIVIDAVLKRVNHIPFDQILFIDFLLNKYYNSSDLSKDYNILRLKLQTMFMLKVENELDGDTDIMKILAYCENNFEIVSSKIVNSLTTSLLLMDDDKFSVMDLTSILIFLANLGELDEHVVKLFRKTLGLWIQAEVTANQVDVLLKVLSAKRNTIDKDRFKDSDFIRKCINLVIQQNDRKVSFSVQNSFNKLVSLRILFFYCFVQITNQFLNCWCVFRELSIRI